MIEYTVKVHNNGTKFWYLNGKLHREDGPAIEFVNGDKSWWINGKLHREDGPAIDQVNRNKLWFFNDEELTEAEFNTRVAKVVTIDGVQYKLTRID